MIVEKKKIVKSDTNISSFMRGADGLTDDYLPNHMNWTLCMSLQSGQMPSHAVINGCEDVIIHANEIEPFLCYDTVCRQTEMSRSTCFC